MSDDREPLTFAEAEAMLTPGETVHVVSAPAPGIMTGANWDRADVLEWIREHGCEKAGPNATRDGHAVASVAQGRRLFFETRAEA